MKKATFIANIFQGSIKNLFQASIGQEFIIEKETENSIYVMNTHSKLVRIDKTNVIIK